MKQSEDANFVMVPLWLVGRVSPPALEVYAALGFWSRWSDVDLERQRHCWPKRESIRQRLSRNSKGELPALKSVDRWISELVRAGAIRKIAVYGGHDESMFKRSSNRRSSNRYEIAIEEPFAVSGDTRVARAATPQSPLSGDTSVATELEQPLESKELEADESAD